MKKTAGVLIEEQAKEEHPLFAFTIVLQDSFSPVIISPTTIDGKEYEIKPETLSIIYRMVCEIKERLAYALNS